MSYHAVYCRSRLADLLRSSPITRAGAARLLWARAAAARNNPTRRLALLARAAHVCPDRFGLAGLREAIRKELERLSPQSVDWGAAGAGDAGRTDLPKAIILKPPVSPAEKGLLHIAFESQWLRLLRSGQAENVARRYDLLLGPSWSPPPDLALLLALKLWPGRLYTLLSNFEDAAAMRALSERLAPVPLLASSWVNPAAYQEHLGRPKDYDVVMLANFSRVKRHWLFFHTLRRLPRRYRVLLLGVPLDGRTEQTIRDEARAFGVEGRFDLHVRPTRAEVARGLARARVSLIFSRLEGSCIAVAESLFADTPVGLFRNARIGSRAFINAQTGRLLGRAGLARQVERFVDEADGYSPLFWARENISCYRSQEVLNRTLRDEALSQGRPWTRDAVPMQNDTFPRYLSAETEAEMRPWNDDFTRRYGLRLGPATLPDGTRLAQVAG
ncbi:MAG TPA: glycosyltransferase [Gemmataceae bacterium]|jgi:glycosyltransferase involved in cell wall biosynthesis|nr:glycosyltransferase [Gemmataceae bacterium]